MCGTRTLFNRRQAVAIATLRHYLPLYHYPLFVASIRVWVARPTHPIACLRVLAAPHGPAVTSLFLFSPILL